MTQAVATILHSASGTLTLDYAQARLFLVQLGANVTGITLDNWPTSGPATGSVRVLFLQDATGGRTITWPAGWTYPTADPPTNKPKAGNTSTAVASRLQVIVSRKGTAVSAWDADYASEDPFHVALSVLLADGFPVADSAKANTNLNNLVSGALLSQGNTAGLAPKASPVFTGTPSGPTAPANTNSTQLATTAFVQGEISGFLTGLAVSGRNYLDNPSFDVWQSGTSFALAAATATPVADRWKARRSSTTGATISRQAGFSGSLYCMRVQRDSGNSSPNVIHLSQQIESRVAAQLAGKTVVLSFDARRGTDFSAASNQVSVIFASGTGIDEALTLSGANPTFPTGNANSSSLTVTIPSSAGRVVFAGYAVPSNATELAFRLAFDPSSSAAGAADYFELTNVKLETGTDTPFEPESPSEVLARCQRFFETSFASGTVPAQNVGLGTGEEMRPAPVAGASSERLGNVSFKVTKRIAPAITIYNPAAANAQVRDETAGADCTATATSSVTERGFEINCTGAATTTAGGKLGFHWVADARF